jgi:GNAT superfamily N-acetyltransferase
VVGGALTRLRSLDPERDRTWLERLWADALAPSWPPLPGALDLARTGLVAERHGEAVGAVVFDPPGSIQLLLVAPARQGQGVGSALLEAAQERCAAEGAGLPSLGGGGGDYIWPGVPADLAPAVRFFSRRGWRLEEVVSDLTADLRTYTAPPGVAERAARAGISLAVATGGELADALDFERRWFPEWLHWFQEPGVSALLARDRDGEVVGSLLLAGPGRCSVFWPMLGEDMATIGAVGVAEPARRRGVGAAMVVRASELLKQAAAGRCHIGWVGLQSFYEQLGYRRWRDYLVSRGSSG